MLRLGDKALDSHLPNSLSAAFKILERQMEQGQSFTLDDFPTRPEDLQDACSEARLLDKFLFSTPQPTTQAPRSERPPQDAPTAPGGIQWHSRVAGSYELTLKNGGASYGLPVVAEVLEQSSSNTEPSITLV